MPYLYHHPLLQATLYLIIIIGVLYVVLFFTFHPSHDRNWELGHEELPLIVFSDISSAVTIENYRNFHWTGTASANIAYETVSFDLDTITGVDVFISHFDDFEGLAHIFLSFGFEEGPHAVISLETRREANEAFSPLKGILRQYEIIYVVGSEEDIVGVRTGHREERVHLYPTKATPEQARELFNLMAVEINDVYRTPRMYNTLTRNCTNELTRPVEEMSTLDFPITWKTIMPGYFDEVLYELQLVDANKPFAEIKATHLVDNDQVDASGTTYSQDLRSSIEYKI